LKTLSPDTLPEVERNMIEGYRKMPDWKELKKVLIGGSMTSAIHGGAPFDSRRGFRGRTPRPLIFAANTLSCRNCAGSAKNVVASATVEMIGVSRRWRDYKIFYATDKNADGAAQCRAIGVCLSIRS
jgi:hypothetical protein